MAKLKTWQERLRDNDFPEPAPWKSPEECQAAYESGFPGAYLDEENWASIPPADSILDGFGADASSGEGELVLLYPELYKRGRKIGGRAFAASWRLCFTLNKKCFDAFACLSDYERKG